MDGGGARRESDSESSKQLPHAAPSTAAAAEEEPPPHRTVVTSDSGVVVAVEGGGGARWAARVPRFTLAMFAVYMGVYYGLGGEAGGQEEDPRAARLELDTRRGAQAWRWYTYSLLHLNALHLGVNMFGVLVYGGLVEAGHGPWRVAAVQTLSILGGAFAAGWETRVTGERLWVIGTSGGNYGLLSSQAGNLALNWAELSVLRRAFFCAMLGCAVTADVVVSAAFHGDAVSYSAHVGGFVFGRVLAGLTLLRNARPLKWERRMQVGAGAAFLAVALAGSVNLGLLGGGAAEE